MNNDKEDNKKKIYAISGLIFIAALSRLLPHIDNFTPIGAIALFGGTYIANKKLAFLIPLAAMFFSDLALQVVYGNGIHSSILFVYGSFALITSLGFILRKRVQLQTIMVSSLLGSLIFFFVTNFGTWLSGFYPYSLQGIVDCYIMAIPFFRGTLMGDLFFNLLLFGTFSLLKWRIPAIAK